jgi:spermidine/putrescine transport system ATP-binding protein
MLDGRLGPANGEIATVQLSTGGEVRVPAARIPSNASGDVRVGVRPEKITISAANGAAPTGVNAVTGLLRMSTYIGVSHQYRVEGPGGRDLTVYVQNLGGEAPRPGDQVVLTWEPANTFIVTPSDDSIDEEEEE